MTQKRTTDCVTPPLNILPDLNFDFYKCDSEDI